MQALNNVSYRDRLQRIIAKHPSEWYYGKDDPMWKTYLDTLTGEHVKWKNYLETFIEKMTWMKQVPGMGPVPWHMHPVVFTDALKINNSQCYCYKQGIVDRPCQSDRDDVTKEDFELLSEQLGVEREVLRAIGLC
jgi:hypothetical protein